MHTKKNNEIFEYQQYLYVICVISLLVICFRFYYAVSYSMFGITLAMLQISIIYFFVKCFNKINFNIILISTILTTGLLILISIYYALVDHFAYIGNLAIQDSIYCFTGFIILLLGYIDTYDEQSVVYKRKYIVQFTLFFSLGIILCAGAAQNVENPQMPKELFLFGVFIFQTLSGYSLFCLSKKWYIFGNILVALYYATARLYMLNFCTSIVASTGWALTYIWALLMEYLLLNGIFTFVIITVLFLYNKCKCYAQTSL